MFRMILALALAIVTTGAAFAQQKNAKEKRAESEAKFNTEIAQSLTDKSFLFIANRYQADESSFKTAVSPSNTFQITPKGVEFDLPYLTYQSLILTPSNYKIQTTEYDYTVTETAKGWEVVIKLRDTMNQAENSGLASSSLNFTFKFRIVRNSGKTTMTLTPDKSNSITYYGFVTPQ